MSAQLLGFVVLVCLAAAHGAKLNKYGTDIVAVEKEGRILQVPTLGDVIFAGLKTTWFLISNAWSLVGYKLAAVALAADVVIWVARNCFSAILGAGLTLAFCKLTGKCNWDWDYAQDYELSELAVAAKHLENGAAKFDMFTS